MTVDARFIEQARADLRNLLAVNPALEEDDVLRLDMIEGETNALELIDKLIEAEKDSSCLEEATGNAIEQLQKRRGRFANRRLLLRKYMMQIMEAANLKKVERPAATVSIAAGRPKVVIIDEGGLPDDYLRIKQEPNKERIAEALKAGRTVNGAILSNPEPVLRIS